MIREYVGTAEGEILAVYKRSGSIMNKKLSNGFYVAEINDGRLNTVYFSRNEAEIDKFIEEKVESGYRKRGMSDV